MDGGWRPLEPGEFILGYRDEDGVLPEAPVPPFARNGTFMVYRKLAQDVPAFERLVRAAADEHFDGDVELVAAKLAGRWRDGSPLMLHPWIDRGRGPREVLNDFRYGGDELGRSCPLGAHVRRANPRDGLPGGAHADAPAPHHPARHPVPAPAPRPRPDLRLLQRQHRRASSRSSTAGSTTATPSASAATPTSWPARGSPARRRA